MKLSRVWAMPNSNTFEVKPIKEFVLKYLKLVGGESVDPFARNNEFATVRNDLNPFTSATHHYEALDFLNTLNGVGRKFSIGLLDPPYSPRQLTECYQEVGKKTTQQDTQAKSWSDWKDALNRVILLNGYVLSFGWNTVGMGKNRGYEIAEIMMVCHGGQHNDTICLAELKTDVTKGEK